MTVPPPPLKSHTHVDTPGGTNPHPRSSLDGGEGGLGGAAMALLSLHVPSKRQCEDVPHSGRAVRSGRRPSARDHSLVGPPAGSHEHAIAVPLTLAGGPPRVPSLKGPTGPLGSCSACLCRGPLRLCVGQRTRGAQTRRGLAQKRPTQSTSQK